MFMQAKEIEVLTDPIYAEMYTYHRFVIPLFAIIEVC